jgi:hypothetical protein
MLKKGYNVVMGVPIPLTDSVEDALRERGLYVEEDDDKAIRLIKELRA